MLNKGRVSQVFLLTILKLTDWWRHFPIEIGIQNIFIWKTEKKMILSAMTKNIVNKWYRYMHIKKEIKITKMYVPSSTYLVFIKVRSINMSLCNQFLSTQIPLS